MPNTPTEDVRAALAAAHGALSDAITDCWELHQEEGERLAFPVLVGAAEVAKTALAEQLAALDAIIGG